MQLPTVKWDQSNMLLEILLEREPRGGGGSIYGLILVDKLLKCKCWWGGGEWEKIFSLQSEIKCFERRLGNAIWMQKKAYFEKIGTINVNNTCRLPVKAPSPLLTDPLISHKHIKTNRLPLSIGGERASEGSQQGYRVSRNFGGIIRFPINGSRK